MKLDELARRIDAQLIGDGAIEIISAAPLEQAGAGQISFLSNPKYAKQLQTTAAAAVVVPRSAEGGRAALLKSADPYYAFTQALVLLYGHRKHPHAGIHPTAHVDPTATVGEGAILYPGVYIGPRVRIGRDCIFYPNVVIYDDCVIGDRVILHAGTSVGQDGFGFATHKGEHHKIPQVGNVIIEDDVEIGANCAIDRAMLGSTVIGKGTKLSDLILVGHGVRIGPHGLLVGQVGIAGSATLGHHVTLAGQAGIVGHLKIGDRATIAAQSGVHNDVPADSVLLGSPAIPIEQARKAMILYSQLPELRQRLRQLEQRLAELEKHGPGGSTRPNKHGK